MSDRIEMRSPVGLGSVMVPADRVDEMKRRGFSMKPRPRKAAPKAKSETEQTD